MYEPLAEPGPRVRSRLAAPLRGALRLANTALTAAGLAILGFSVYMAVQYHHGGLLPPAPPATQPEMPEGLGASVGGSPWFIYFAAGVGLYLVTTAAAGMSGLRAGNRRRLALHTALLAGAVLAEASTLLVVFGGDSWRQRLPPDASGWLDKALAFADANARLVKLAGLATLLAQLLALGAACWLSAIYDQAYDDWLDDVEERRERVWRVLGRSAEQSYASGGAGSAWGARLRGKYGVVSSEFSDAAERARQTSLLVDAPPDA